jgi:hypothetical protein
MIVQPATLHPRSQGTARAPGRKGRAMVFGSIDQRD